jgi:hypothetical protein
MGSRRQSATFRNDLLLDRSWSAAAAWPSDRRVNRRSSRPRRDANRPLWLDGANDLLIRRLCTRCKPSWRVGFGKTTGSSPRSDDLVVKTASVAYRRNDPYSVLLGRDVTQPWWNLALPDIAETSRGGKRIEPFDLLRHAIVAVCAREQAENPVARVSRFGDEKGPAWSKDAPHLAQRTPPQIFG